jgi:hypothetical protein
LKKEIKEDIRRWKDHSCFHGLAKLNVFLIIFYVFVSTKLENKRAEQVLPGGEGEGGCGSNNLSTCK